MSTDLRTALRSLWPSLPTWLTASVLICGTSGATLLAGAGVTPVTLLLGAALTGPAWAATVAAAACALDGEQVSVRTYVGLLRRHAWAGVRTAAVPACIGALELVTVEMLRARPDQTWLYVPVTVGALACLAVALAAVFAFPLRLRHGLSGRALWLTAASVVAVAPVVPLGVLAAVTLAVLSGTELSASLLLLMPAPLALLDVVAARSATARVHSLATDEEQGTLSDPGTPPPATRRRGSPAPSRR